VDGLQWNRGLGEIVQALLDAAFTIELLHEHRDAEWQAFPHMIRNEVALRDLRDAVTIATVDTQGGNPPLNGRQAYDPDY
jgi:hypothetical protein